MTILLQFTVNVRKSHRQPQYTVELVSDDRVLFVGVDLARFSMRAASSKMRPSNFYRASTFLLWTSPCVQPHKQKSKELCLEILVAHEWDHRGPILSTKKVSFFCTKVF
jgi:hypothetical protein